MFSFHLRCRFFSLICTVFASIISSIWFLWWIFLPFSIFSSSTLSIVCIFQFLFHSCYATWLIQCRRHINNAHHFTSFLSLSHAMSRDSWKSINIVSDPGSISDKHSKGENQIQIFSIWCWNWFSTFEKWFFAYHIKWHILLVCMHWIYYMYIWWKNK